MPMRSPGVLGAVRVRHAGWGAWPGAALGGRLDAVVDLAGGNPEAVRGEHVTAAARRAMREALAVLDESAHWIALGLANLINLLDPELIVIGGVVEAG